MTSGRPERPPAFKDHFSGQAATYAEFRPEYPPALFDFAASLVARRNVAWDCGTGSGQAAVALAGHFARVVATDASEAQIDAARARRPHARVEYRVAPAEDSRLPDASVDLVTVAQSLHWFDLPRFYAEVRRVVAPGGALAVWTYGDAVLDEPALDETLQRFNRVTVGPYWPPERRLVDEGYRTLPFPFAETSAPAFTLERAWTLGELAGYLRSWSATARYAAAQGVDPVAPLEAELATRWGAPDVRRVVRWPLTIRAGSVGPVGAGG
jgi:SAM-dependent methyltransferase